jgi:DNA-binding GntR family transcriptional regulator
VNVLQPIAQQTAPVAVYERLRRAILDGHLPAGSPLREAHLAKDLGISRSPLREAFNRLEEEGLVEKIPYRGAFVAQVSAKTIAEISSVRTLVEPHAVEQALPALRGEHRLALLDRIDALRRSARAGDPVGLIDAHLAFHGVFYEYCGNAVLADMWSGWQGRLRLFLVADHSGYGDPREVFEVHQDFIDAVLAEDVHGIRAHVVHHLHAIPDS